MPKLNKVLNVIAVIGLIKLSFLIYAANIPSTVTCIMLFPSDAHRYQNIIVGLAFDGVMLAVYISFMVFAITKKNEFLKIVSGIGIALILVFAALAIKTDLSASNPCQFMGERLFSGVMSIFTKN